MTTPASPPAADRTLRVGDLIGRPGASRRLDLSMAAPEDLELDLAEIVGPIKLEGVVESVVDGLLVRGELSVPLKMQCARCLVDLEAMVSTEVVELFTDPQRADDPGDVEEGYEVRDEQLDLETLIRDALVPAVPYRPLCDEACQGLCPSCGINRNEATCDCADVSADPRWAALEGVRLSDGDERPQA
jgi:uncharacterized protein